MKRIRLVSSLAAAATIITVGLAGCGNSSTNPSSKTQKLNWMTNASISTLDPSKAVDVVSGQTLYNSNQGLLVLAGENKVAPGIAKSYHVSKDGKTYTFNLRKSKWSNGQPLTAKDFVYGFQRSADPKTASQMGYYLGDIQGYDKIKTGAASVKTLGVKAVNDYKLVVKLVKPQQTFKTALTLSVFYPQSQSTVKKYGSRYGTSSDRIISNGPYTVTNWTGSNDKWTLKKNPYYWDQSQTKLKQITFNVFKDPQTALNEYQTGKLDELQLNTKQQVAHFKNSKELYKRNTFAIKYLSINQSKAPAFKNIKLRRALSLAINREQLVSTLLGDGSKAAKGFVPSGMSSYQGQDFTKAAAVPNTANYDLAQAKKLWNQGLKETGLKSVSVSLMNNDDNNSKQLSEFIQSQLQALPGLKITNELLPNTTATAKSLKSDYQLSVSGWDPSISDPISPLQTKLSTSAINTSKWSNSKYDDFISRAKDQDANDPAKRWNDLVSAEKIIMQDQGVIPLYQEAMPEVIKSNVKNVKYYPNGTVWDFSKAYIK